MCVFHVTLGYSNQRKDKATHKHFMSSSLGMPSRLVKALPSRNSAFKLVYSSKLAMWVKPLKLR